MDTRPLFKAFVLLTTCLPFVHCDNDLISKLLSGYDRAIRPGFVERKATVILADLQIESFGNIEEANMEYKVFAYFNQHWTDTRLAGKLNRTFVMKGSDIENFWVPDPYCYNARESNMMVPNAEVHSSLTVQPDGSILYGRGVTLLCSCIMDLREFPHDFQSCFLKFGSYSYTIKDIIFKWKTRNVSVGNEEMAQFLFKGTKLTSTTDVYITGNYSTLTATFSFERRIGYYLIQVYFPDIFVVSLSWIVFWMDKTEMGERMALGITTILTIMFLLGSLNGTLPKVSYPKALDWYLLVSFSFVFLSVMECMVVFIFTQCDNADQKMKCKVNNVPLSKRISKSIRSAFNTSKEKTNIPRMDDTDGNGVLNFGPDNNLEMVIRASKPTKAVMDDGELEDRGERNRNEKIADRIDQISRVLYPLAFIIYNIFYWAYYQRR